ncbi:hepatocyte growth factor receptor, partial [Striga asiatica]
MPARVERVVRQSDFDHYTKNGSNKTMTSSRSREVYEVDLPKKYEVLSDLLESESIAPRINVAKFGEFSDEQRNKKDSTQLPTTKKRKACNRKRQRPKPRDSQLKHEALATQGCGIGGLLDKTIKHLPFSVDLLLVVDCCVCGHPRSVLRVAFVESTDQVSEICGSLTFAHYLNIDSTPSHSSNY